MKPDGNVKRIWPALVTAAVLASAAAMPPSPALSQEVELAVVDVKTVARGYRASKLKDKPVVNQQNEKIGSVDDVIIGKDGGVYAVLQVGGFLGIGERLVAVPYKSLSLDDQSGRIVLPGASREALKKLPVFKHIG